MKQSKLYPLVSLSNVQISLSKTSHFSIGTSPYYSHQIAAALDIYESIAIENYEVLSPVSGKILQIKQIKTPPARFKDGIQKDYLTLIENPDDNQTIFKILHIKPEVLEGQYIQAGELLGTTIRNGYFAPWSSPHVHLELKMPKDALRAKRGLHFKLNTKEQSKNATMKQESYNQIPIKIDYICEEFFLGRFPDDLYLCIDPIYGVKVTINKTDYIIDGGIPQYKQGVIHFFKETDAKNLNEIYLNDVRIGSLSGCHEHYGFVAFDNIKLLLNDKLIRGISLFLARSHPLIKIIPFHNDDFEIELNSMQFLRILPNKL